jgi:hypothetical protein
MAERTTRERRHTPIVDTTRHDRSARPTLQSDLEPTAPHHGTRRAAGVEDVQRPQSRHQQQASFHVRLGRPAGQSVDDMIASAPAGASGSMTISSRRAPSSSNAVATRPGLGDQLSAQGRSMSTECTKARAESEAGLRPRLSCPMLGAVGLPAAIQHPVAGDRGLPLVVRPQRVPRHAWSSSPVFGLGGSSVRGPAVPPLCGSICGRGSPRGAV